MQPIISMPNLVYAAPDKPSRGDVARITAGSALALREAAVVVEAVACRLAATHPSSMVGHLSHVADDIRRVAGLIDRGNPWEIGTGGGSEGV